MQEVILDILKKNKKELPSWILQKELEDFLSIKLNRQNNGFHACFSKALFRMRKHEEIIFTKVNSLDKLKELDRHDLLNAEQKFKIRHFSYAYCVKKIK